MKVCFRRQHLPTSIKTLHLMINQVLIGSRFCRPGNLHCYLLVEQKHTILLFVHKTNIHPVVLFLHSLSVLTWASH
jgi:hypothetical protein